MDKWKRKLFGSQYLDNYFPEDQFLVFLKTNLFTPIYSPHQLLFSSLNVSTHFSFAMLLVISAVAFGNEALDALLFCTCSITLFLYLLYLNSSSLLFEFNQIYKDIKSVCIIITFLYALSPRIHSLVAQISSDTIWFMIIILILFNFIFHNFQSTDERELASQRLSFNFGMSASVCLASRVEIPRQSLAIIIFAFQIFFLYPAFIKRMKYENKSINFITFPILFIIITAISFLLNQIHLFSLYVLILILVNVISPLLFLNLQKLKNNIYGPWDETLFIPLNSDKIE